MNSNREEKLYFVKTRAPGEPPRARWVWAFGYYLITDPGLGVSFKTETGVPFLLLSDVVEFRSATEEEIEKCIEEEDEDSPYYEEEAIEEDAS